MSESSPLRRQIKEVVIESLSLEGTTPEMIADDANLFGDEGLGLDSVDALELMVVFEKRFGIAIDFEELDPEAFSTVAGMEEMILELSPEAASKVASKPGLQTAGST